MRYTNKYGLPKAFAAAVIEINEQYEYGEGVFRSNTGLIAPPQLMALRYKYRDQLVVDVASLVYSVMGKAAHIVMENVPGSEMLREETFRFEVAGKLIQTTIDLYNLDFAKLTDWKQTSLWAVTKKEPKPEWVAQLNVGAHALREHDYSPKKLEIIAILRDWSKKKARIEHLRAWTSYPKHQVVKVEIPLWTPEQTVEYITERIGEHALTEGLSDEELSIQIPCSSEDRWEKPPKFAVKKKGRQSAVRVLDSMGAALKFIRDKGWHNDPAYTVETRPGESPRCQDYCDVSEYCHQWRNTKHLYQEAA